MQKLTHHQITVVREIFGTSLTRKKIKQTVSSDWYMAFRRQILWPIQAFKSYLTQIFLGKSLISVDFQVVVQQLVGRVTKKSRISVTQVTGPPKLPK